MRTHIPYPISLILLLTRLFAVSVLGQSLPSWQGELLLVRNDLSAGHADQALILLQPALDRVKNGNADSAECAEVLFQSGNIYLALGDPVKAISAYKSGRKYARDPLQFSRFDQNLGASWLLFGDAQRAVRYLNHAWVTLQTSGFQAPTREIALSEDLGAASFESGEYSTAREWWQKCLELRSLNLPEDQLALATLLIDLGNVSFEMSDWSDASGYYRDSRETLMQANQLSGIEQAWILQNIARALVREGHADSAFACLKLAACSLQPQSRMSKVILAGLYRAEGSLWMTLDSTREALESNSKGLHLLDSIQHPGFPTPYPAFLERYRLMRYMGYAVYQLDRKSAFPILDSCIRLQKELLEDYGYLPELSGEESPDLLYRRAISAGYDRCPACTGTLAQLFSEQCKMYECSTAGVDKGCSDSTERDLERRVYYQHRLHLLRADRFGLLDPVHEEEDFRLIQMQDSLVSAKKAAKTTAAIHDALSAEGNLREQLETGEMLLQYLLCDNRLFIFACTRDSCRIVAAEVGPGLPGLFTEFRQSLATDDREVADSLSLVLSGILLKPVDPYLEGITSLRIIPDAAMEAIPFECLRLPGSREFLISRYDILYSEVPPSEKPNLISYPISFSGYAPSFTENDRKGQLKYNIQEIESIAKLFQSMGLEAQVLEGPDASEQALLSDVHPAEIIHIASHSQVDRSHSELSGILLWNEDSGSSGDPLIDGILELGELGTLQLQCDLLVLSSCTLQQSSAHLLSSTAPNVLFSLWNVPDRSTSVLMERFYQYYLSGLSYPKALQKAKIELIRDPATADPVHWGGFVLYTRR